MIDTIAGTYSRLVLRTDVQLVPMPAKHASGRTSAKANQIGGFPPSGRASFSEKW
jgi:hypothetical protein